MSLAEGVSLVCMRGLVRIRDGAGVCIDSETNITSSSSSSDNEGREISYKGNKI